MVHILKENLAGVFDVSYDRYETFEEGLMRYRIQTLCKTAEDQQKVRDEFLQTEASKKIDSAKEIDPYREVVAYYSEYDKYEYSIEVKDPIRQPKEFVSGGPPPPLEAFDDY